MSNVAVCVGMQFGDEGKGKFVDWLASNYDIIARFNGSANAGHTLWVNGKKTVLHHIPSGILHPNTICVIGNGCVISPTILKKEIEQLEAQGIQVQGRLFISYHAHVITDEHQSLDQNTSKGKIGTTGKGVGPAYADKAYRTGIRMCDLADWMISGYLTDTEKYINERLDQGYRVLAEGAQAAGLDIDHGTYPYVTSSNTIAGAVCTGLGVSPKMIGQIYGVFKAYTTRVGKGPFPTKLLGEEAEQIRKLGNEFGSTTGRPRDVGWLDLVELKKAQRINRCDKFIMTKLDVLNSLDEFKVCVYYEVVDYGAYIQEEPVYITCREQSFDARVRWLNSVLKFYLGQELEVIGTGPNREDIRYMNEFEK